MATSLPMARHSRTMVCVTNVLPLPGPPNRRHAREFTAKVTAAFCSALSSVPFTDVACWGGAAGGQQGISRGSAGGQQGID
eukprot:512217-Prorocentrum_minimum.AAC.3